MAPSPPSPAAAPLSQRVGFDAAHLYPNTPDDIRAELDSVKDLGGGWVRGDFTWPSIERSRGVYEFSKIDVLVNEVNARGLHLMGQLTYGPAWAGPGGLPTNNADYADYAAAMARRYAPKGVHAWEIWNEANLTGPWPGTPDPAKYTAMLKAAYLAIHAVDPHATVVTSGLAPASNVSGYSIRPASFVQGIYDNGGAGYFDAVGLHPHTTPYPSTIEQPWNPMVQARDLIYPMMQRHGDGAKKIWATEAGFSVSSNTSKSVTEALQGDRVNLMIHTWLSFPFAGPIFVYLLRDPGSDFSNWFDGFGLMRENWSHKPGYAVVKSYLHHG
ncbi:MAG: hypothetical protein QOI55_943 [Actinomycetota bacterium]|nr:hypothetical protein [Actinomycetota bacterium]